MTKVPTLGHGVVLSRYRIESLLGAGGMGEVYRALDLNLGRPVALKILPSGLMNEEVRVRRFELEARSASALNHPAIISIYEVGVSDGVHFIAMELVEGQTLDRHPHVNGERRRLLDQMAQVADGLAAAHLAGIVHRDLKPENIMISKAGFPKILDFGVAKLVEVRPGSTHPSSDSRVTEPLSLLGTVAYMSPEQLSGDEVDSRSDVFSFGVVLYEALTGTHPFEAGSRVDTMHRIVHERQAPLAELRADLSPDLERIIRRCLQKDPNERYQSMRDLTLDLREAIEAEQQRSLRPKVPEHPKTRRRVRWLAPVAMLAVLAAGWMGYRTMDRSGTASAAMVSPHRDEALSPMEITRLTTSGQTITAAISPDGNYLAHVQLDGDKQSLWIKQVATGTYMQIIPPSVSIYGWLTVSDDGNYIYFSRSDFPEFNVNDVYRVPMLGGEMLRVVRNIDGDLAISPDGSQLAYTRFNAEERDRRLFVSQSDGTGERQLLTRRYPQFMGSPVWKPDGRNLYLRLGADDSGLLKISEEERRNLHTAVEIDVLSGAMTDVRSEGTERIGESVWLPDGSGMIAKIFHRQQPPQLYFVAGPGSTPRKITNDLNGYDNISVTADSSTIVAVRHEKTSNLWIVDQQNPRRPIEITRGENLYGLDGAPRWTAEGDLIVPVWDGRAALQLISAEGKLVRKLTDKSNYGVPRLSNDRAKLAFITDREGGVQIWVSEADGNDPRPVVVGGRPNFPSFTPDGRSLVYANGGTDQFAWKVSLHGGAPVQLTTKPTHIPIASPDGRWLLCRYRAAEPGHPLWRTAILPLDRPGPPVFYDRPLNAGGPRLDWHPDSKRFAYVDWHGGVANVWLQSLEGGEPEQVTFFDSGTINSFDWSPDGQLLVVARGEGKSDAVMIRNFR